MTPREEYILLTITALVVIVIGALWLSFLASCSHASPRAPSPGVPPSVLRLDRGDCSSWLVRPAVLCAGGPFPGFNGCDWRCVQELQQ